MSSRLLKTQLFSHFARIGKAVASPRRLELLDLLGQGEASVESLALRTGMSVASTSQHLQVLRGARLVEVRRDGLYAFYRLADDSVFRFFRQLEELGQRRLAEVDQILRLFFHERDTLEPVDAEELLGRLGDGEVILLDVRPAEEFHRGHIPGALSVPVAELESRLSEIPAAGEVVAYCRGPYCVLSLEAVELLRRHGVKARRLRQGMPDWRVQGLPVATGEGGDVA